jgi:hypothetical protein
MITYRAVMLSILTLTIVSHSRRTNPMKPFMIQFFRFVRRASLVVVLGIATVADSQAASLSVVGRLEGDIETVLYDGDTMDFYKFEVATAGSLKIEGRRDAILVLLSSYIGVETEFAFVGNPFRLDTSTPCVTPGCLGDVTVSLEPTLPVGVYVITISAGGPTSYDIFDGYKAVNREGGGFSSFEYQVTITGAVRGLEYWDGHLDSTFTVTSIPEPSTSVQFGVLGDLTLKRKRKQKTV